MLERGVCVLAHSFLDYATSISTIQESVHDFFLIEKSNKRLLIYCCPFYYHNASRGQSLKIITSGSRLSKFDVVCLKRNLVFRGELNR